jgi:hypothetical protein
MRPPLRRFLVTVRVDESRTRDVCLRADSAYAAGWLCRQLHEGVRITAIRYADVADRPTDDGP